ncbi:hypothetical protein B0H14DRAFT_2572793 [Mycena olivaceomarginata]|nr:hypothetical protein B0H14DRAFT_2572793 [Mycena olivaceomarginata]
MYTRETRADHYTKRLDPAADEKKPAVSLTFQVTDPRKQSLFLQVAKQALNDLKDEDVWPDGLRRKSSEPKLTWDLALLKHLAMLSFRNLKRNWKRATNAAAAERGKASSQGDRRNKRRQTAYNAVHSALKRLSPTLFRFQRNFDYEPVLFTATCIRVFAQYNVGVCFGKTLPEVAPAHYIIFVKAMNEWDDSGFGWAYIEDGFVPQSRKAGVSKNTAQSRHVPKPAQSRVPENSAQSWESKNSAQSRGQKLGEGVYT